MKTFAVLFKKYRLRAEFATLSEFGKALAEKGFIYDDSAFSQWQHGTRLPSRAVLLKLISLFVERESIRSSYEANLLLSSANYGYLTDEEIERLHLRKTTDIPFQVPNEIANFTGREEIIKKILKEIKSERVFLLHGPPGVGKTALAIKLGHLLKEKFSDGVLWYKVEEDNVMDILLSLAKTFGEDISGIHDLQVRITVVRSLLASKNVLLFFDSAELYDEIHLLIPNSIRCTTIFTSQNDHLKVQINYMNIPIKPFSDQEVVTLFKNILGKQYGTTTDILAIANRVGNLPLALHILVRQILYTKLDIKKIAENGDKNLYATIATSYKKLGTEMKSVLVSASIFKGKDFSAESIAHINGLTKSVTIKKMQMLVDFSLVEYSTKNRYRLHPAIREFVRDKLDHPRGLYLQLIATIIFSFFILFWMYLQIFLDTGHIMYAIFSFSYSMLALFGGLYGINTAWKWGGLRTLLGKAIVMFSIGLLMQTFGQITYSYYTNLLKVPIPYPSVGDIGYFGTIPFYTYGTFLLAKSSGIEISIRSFKRKMIALVIPTIILTIAYLLFLHDYRFDVNNPIKIFLDFGYPLGEAMYISIAFITFIFSRTVLDGIMRSKALLILIALVVQFAADYIFLYQQENYYQGSYIDLVYLIAYFIMTLALLNLKSIFVHVKATDFQ